MSGVILQTVGDSSFLQEVSKVYVHPGAYWSEEIHGTNTVGTIPEEKRPLAVLGTDHYLTTNQLYSCVGSPIFSPTGELKGVLNITGHSSNKHIPKMLNFVDIIARKIENNILMEHSKKQIVISLSNHKVSQFEALIAIDEEGLITGMNRSAREILLLDQLQSHSIHLSDLIPDGYQLINNLTVANSLYNIITIKKQDFEDRFVVSVLTNSYPKKTFVNEKESLQNNSAKTNKKLSGHFSRLIGTDPDFIQALKNAESVAPTNYSISITGESGTGKDLLSYSIHQASKRKDKPFVALNCGGITKSLAESELFGYEAGAFTGAKHSGHAGVFERANGGTLFLDEIAELPLDIQASLLRVLQDFKVTRIGGVKATQLDLRLITATHTDLWKKVQEGTFREDLFYRLQGVQITIPPLRNRIDRLDYANYFLKEIEKELHVDSLQFSQCAEELILSYRWPGNVRQLKSALRESSFLARSGIIEASHFPTYITNSIDQNISTNSLLQDVENRTITQTLKRTNGNISETARILGISRNTLYRKLEIIRQNNS